MLKFIVNRKFVSLSIFSFSWLLFDFNHIKSQISMSQIMETDGYSHGIQRECLEQYIWGRTNILPLEHLSSPWELWRSSTHSPDGLKSYRTHLQQVECFGFLFWPFWWSSWQWLTLGPLFWLLSWWSVHYQGLPW